MKNDVSDSLVPEAKQNLTTATTIGAVLTTRSLRSRLPVECELLSFSYLVAREEFGSD